MFLIKNQILKYLGIVLTSLGISTYIGYTNFSWSLVIFLVCINILIITATLPILVLKDVKNKLGLVTAYKKYKNGEMTKEQFYGACMNELVDTVDHPVVSTAHTLAQTTKGSKLINDLINKVKQ